MPLCVTWVNTSCTHLMVMHRREGYHSLYAWTMPDRTSYFTVAHGLVVAWACMCVCVLFVDHLSIVCFFLFVCLCGQEEDEYSILTQLSEAWLHMAVVSFPMLYMCNHDCCMCVYVCLSVCLCAGVSVDITHCTRCIGVRMGVYVCIYCAVRVCMDAGEVPVLVQS